MLFLENNFSSLILQSAFYEHKFSSFRYDFFCLVVYTVATFIEVVPSVRSTPNGYEPFGMLKKR